MTPSGIAEFNAGGPELQDGLLACCDVPRWVEAVLAQRPYDSVEGLLDAADSAARTFTGVEVERALAAHPRIGERAAGADVSARWSRDEQSAASSSSSDQSAGALLEANRAYEQRFGRVFLICASGRSADEVVDAAQRRLHNDDDTELAVVADELRQIALLRLRRFADPAADPAAGIEVVTR